MPRLNVSNDFFHAHERPRAPGQGAGGARAHPGQRARLRGHLRGLVLPTLRGLQDRRGGGATTTCARSTARRSSARRRTTTSSACPPFRTGSSSCSTHSRTSSCRATATTRARAFIESGLQDVSLSRSTFTWGVAGPVGREPRLLRVVSRRCSTTTPRLSYAKARRGSDRPLLAGPVSLHRQGHPEVPHDLLAGDAHGRP